MKTSPRIKPGNFPLPALPWEPVRERAVIGSLLAGGSRLFDQYRAILTREHFLGTAAREIWSRMEELHGQGVDWKDTEPLYESPLDRPQWKFFPDVSRENLSLYLDVLNVIFRHDDVREVQIACGPLIECWRKRRIVAESLELVQRCSSDFTKSAAEVVSEFCGRMSDFCSDDLTQLPGEGIDAPALVNRFSDHLERARQNIDASGLQTHLGKLNSIIGGLRSANLICVGALPGIGKTALACNLIWHVTKAERRVFFVSAEMSAIEIVARLTSLESRVPGDLLINRPNRLSRQQVEESHLALGRLYKRLLSVDDNPRVTTKDLSWQCRRVKSRMGGLDLIVVDYLQIIEADRDRRDSRYESVSEVTRDLKGLSKEFKVPVLALAQLNRQAHGEIPEMRHFKETGQIEQESDVAMILFKTRDEKVLRRMGISSDGDEDHYLLKVDKNRNGRKGVVRLEFNPEIMLFTEKGAA